MCHCQVFSSIANQLTERVRACASSRMTRFPRSDHSQPLTICFREKKKLSGVTQWVAVAAKRHFFFSFLNIEMQSSISIFSSSFNVYLHKPHTSRFAFVILYTFEYMSLHNNRRPVGEPFSFLNITWLLINNALIKLL